MVPLVRHCMQRPTRNTMLAWQEIETVLLDMDGTLIDLHFDNYFWQRLVPERWGASRGLSLESARQQLAPVPAPSIGIVWITGASSSGSTFWRSSGRLPTRSSGERMCAAPPRRRA